MDTIGCPTCSVTVHGDGHQTHDPNCVMEHNAKLKAALHKISHILKEVGITVVETGAVIATSGLGAMQD